MKRLYVDLHLSLVTDPHYEMHKKEKRRSKEPLVLYNREITSKIL